jgi:hypothetical protein
MEIFFFWLILAILVGVFASKRGRSGFGWFLLSVLLSPLICFLIVLCLADLKPVAPMPVVVHAPNESTQKNSGVADELQRLLALHQQGHLSEDEYRGAKNKVLGI